MLQHLYAIVKKNIQRLLRKRTSFFVIFFGPLFLILLMGLAFNNSSLHGISMGLVIQEEDPALDHFMSTLYAHKDFKIRRFDDEESCIDNVKKLNIHLCISVITQDVEKPTVRYFVDYSNIKLVWILIDSLSKSANQGSAMLSEEMITNLLDVMRLSITDIGSGTDELSLLSSDLQNLSSSLDYIRSILSEESGSLGVGSDNITDFRMSIETGKQDMDDQKQDFESESENIEDTLDQQERDLAEYEQTVKERKERTIEHKESMDSAYDTLSCSEYNNRDLSPYLDDEDRLLSELNSSENPACTLIYTSQSELQATVEELEEIEQDLSEAKDTLGEVRDDFDSFQSDIDSIYANSEMGYEQQSEYLDEIALNLDEAQEMMEQANQDKQKILEDLDEIAEFVETGSLKLVELQNSLHGIEDDMTSLSSFSATDITKPYTVQIQPITGEKNTLFFMFPSFLVMMVCFISIIVGSTIEIKERISNAYIRNLIAPVKQIVFIIGTYLSAMAITIVEMLVIMVIANLIFGISLFNKPLIFVLIIFASMVFTSIGMIVSNLLNNEETVTLISIIISCALLLFSNTVLPLENMDKIIASIARISPFVIFENLFRKIIIFDSGLSSIINGLILVIFEFTILFAILYFAKRQSIKAIE